MPFVCLTRWGRLGGPIGHLQIYLKAGEHEISTDRMASPPPGSPLEAPITFAFRTSRSMEWPTPVGARAASNCSTAAVSPKIVGNRIHDVGRVCTDTTNGQVGIYIEQNNVLVDGNRIHDIGRFAPGQQGCQPIQ